MTTFGFFGFLFITGCFATFFAETIKQIFFFKKKFKIDIKLIAGVKKTIKNNWLCILIFALADQE